MDPPGEPAEDVAAELAAYAGPGFARPAGPVDLPLRDEPCAAAWAGYAAEAAEAGVPVWEVLASRLPQLMFPVCETWAASEAYRAAVRRGDLSGAPRTPPALARPGEFRLTLHPTIAGRIAVLEPAGRADFETVMQALARRNRPDPIAPSQGAAIVGGFSNWDRIAALRAAWEAGNGSDAEGWTRHFANRVVPDKPAYQDRFVVLSDGPYSGLPAARMGLSDAEWRARSRTIRLEHECVHYATRRICGSMRNNIHDELIADYFGLVAAFGRFDAAAFLAFVGAEGAGLPRADGRFAIYRGDPPLSDAAFAELAARLRDAAHALERLHDARLAPLHADAAGRGRVLLALSFLTLAALAAEDAEARLEAALADAEGLCRTA